MLHCNLKTLSITRSQLSSSDILIPGVIYRPNGMNYIGAVAVKKIEE